MLYTGIREAAKFAHNIVVGESKVCTPNGVVAVAEDVTLNGTAYIVNGHMYDFWDLEIVER